MRILFTFIGGNGHFLPLVPVARAAETVDHVVAFACGPMMVPTVEAANFDVLQLGEGSASPPGKRPLRPLDLAREYQEFRDRFARDGAEYRVPYVIDVCRKWQPDIIVCDETDFGSMIAAEVLDLPYTTVLVMAAGSFVQAEMIREVLNELRKKYALPSDPELNMLSRYLVLSPFPPRFRDPECPLPSTGYSFRPELAQKTDGKLLSWLSKRPDLPTVYFTLGTIFNLESGDLFERVLEGLCDLPVNVIVTVGPFFNDADLGAQPANVYIESYIPQDLILPHCDLVVSHGGSGSMSGVLLHGLPSVLIPMGADQPLNAARCQKLGMAQVLDPIETTPDSVRSAAADVLSDPGYRRRVEIIRDEFIALPGPANTIPLLERLAVEKRPLVNVQK
jgi:UDP:flavonoid glycosyltransferase YjiC (YdhE family)